MSNTDSNKNQDRLTFEELVEANPGWFDVGLEEIFRYSSNDIIQQNNDVMLSDIPQSSQTQVFQNPTHVMESHIPQSSETQVFQNPTPVMESHIPQSSQTQVSPKPINFTLVPNNNINVDQYPPSADLQAKFGEVKDDYSLFSIAEWARKHCPLSPPKGDKSSSPAAENSIGVVTIDAGAGSSSGGHVRSVPNSSSDLKLLDCSTNSKGKALIGSDGSSFTMKNASPLSRPQLNSAAILKSDCGVGSNCRTWIAMMNSQTEMLSDPRKRIAISPENTGMINLQQGQENYMLKTQGAGEYYLQPEYMQVQQQQQQQQQFQTNFQPRTDIDDYNSYFQLLLGPGTDLQKPTIFSNNLPQYPQQLSLAPQYDMLQNVSDSVPNMLLLASNKEKSAADRKRNLSMMIQNPHIEIIDVDEYESPNQVVVADNVEPQVAGNIIIDVADDDEESELVNMGPVNMEIVIPGGVDHENDEVNKIKDTGYVGIEIADAGASDFKLENAMPIENGFEMGNEFFPNYMEVELMSVDRFGFPI